MCYYDRGRSLWVHRPPVSGSVYQFKFHNRRVYARYYAGVMKEQFDRLIRKWNVQAIVPVPMDHKKRRRRGYNQAECFAKALSEKSRHKDGKMGLCAE